ncbi:MAG: DUF2975 domain-containing protein [Tissierella sp.]|uniref:DUF2975 domain-containing protein n=1 Tax=Tissierella sp. TaxID=41274 RepID=UPI003F9B29E4
MKTWKINILKLAVSLISIIILLLLIFFIPGIANYFEETAPEFGHMKWPLILGIYLTGLPFFIAVFNVFRLIKLIDVDAVFTMKSIKHLNIISKCSISEIIIYFLGLIYLYIEKAMQPGIVLLSLLIIFASFVIYVLIEILKELLLKAVKIKNENDLTI